jgi:ABC-type transport system involved in multi-copper enzyme maturation permease subunit
MLLGPIFTADLVTSSRRTRYFLWRIAYGLILLFTLWTNYETVTYRREVSISTAASLAESFFSSFAYLQILAILAIAPAMAGGSIAQERERRTLEYLLATDLTTTEIVFGKLASRVLQIGAAILTGLPIMSIAGLLGGIDPQRLLMVMLLSGTTLLVVCCLAMAISTRAPRAKDGVTRSYFALAALLLGPFFAMLILNSLGFQAAGDWAGTLMAFNPLATLSQMLIRGMPLRPWVTFTWTIGLHLAVSAACVLLVYTKVRNVETVGQPRVKRLKGTAARSVSDDWPMLWKEIRLKRRVTRWAVAARVLLFALLAVYLFAMVPMAGRAGAAAMLEMLIVTLACFGLLSIAARSATAIIGERERFTWESLRLTLLTDREILWAKFCGAVYSAWGMAVVIVLLWMALLLASPKLLLGAILWTGIAVVLVAYAAALGIRYSISGKNSVRAMIWTLGTSIFLGGGYFFCCAPMMTGSGNGTELVVAPAVPYLLTYPLFMLDEYGPRDGGWTLAFIIGCGGYLLAAVLLFVASLKALEQREGE